MVWKRRRGQIFGNPLTISLVAKLTVMMLLMRSTLRTSVTSEELEDARRIEAETQELEEIRTELDSPDPEPKADANP